jgi:hypothetical protein
MVLLALLLPPLQWVHVLIGEMLKSLLLLVQV